MSIQAGKDTIYIDVDDEITTIIDKVRDSEHRIVALVLPKRAAVLQSIVNMKLLKRTADRAKKHLVLITSEAGLMPLAGAVGLHVAKTLQSKPEIPDGPQGGRAEDDEDTVDMNGNADEDAPLDKHRPIGEYAAGAAGLAAMGDADEDAIELDNADVDNLPDAPAKGKKAKKSKLDKKLKVPDFNKFRLWIMLGGVGLVLLIFVLYMALSVMPRASVAIRTNSSAIQTNQDITLDTAAKTVSTSSLTVPAKQQQTQKTTTQQVAATGQKDNGTKAIGTIYFYDCNMQDLIFGNTVTLPAGTAVSTNNLTFITMQAVVVPPSHFNGDQSCKKDVKSSSVGIYAQSAGDKYNLPASNYSVSGNNNVIGVGSATTGGTSQIVTVVSQADIDGAKQKLAAADTAAIKSELRQALQGQGLLPIDATFAAGTPDVSTSANVGDEAANVTATQKATYTMLGVNQNDVKQIIAFEVKQKIDPTKQSILDYGLDSMSFRLQSQQAATAVVTLTDTAVAGTDINVNDIKKQVAGKKAAEAKSIIGTYPGVTNVTVNYSPFWVTSIPKKTSKITVTIEKPTVKNAK
ncbi:MAG TPA: hypothetical protein VIR03_02750 [Candidatus Saccharimonadales bacterium]